MTSTGDLIDGRYRLERKLGSGGMAIVWLATDERLGRSVAVKFLSDALADDRDYRTRFEREARIAAGLSHPNLVTIHDTGMSAERPYLVMEHIDGDTLEPRARGRGMNHRRGESLARELLGALAAIHAAGVIHRDVKPANVMIDGGGKAHLTDFGIARSAEQTGLTAAGQAIGTRDYMAPELLEGSEATPHSDLYSLGVLLRECVAGSGRGRIGELITALTQPDAANRPADAGEAARILDGKTPKLAGAAAAGAGAAGAAVAATEVMPGAGAEPTGRIGTALTEQLRRRDLRPFAVLAGAIALAAIIAVLAGGGDDSGSPTAAKPPATTAEEQPAEPAPEATPAPQPDPTPAPPTCEQLAVMVIALENREEQLSDAEHEAEGDEKDAIKEQREAVKEQRETVEDRLKENCEESEDGGKDKPDPPGKAKGHEKDFEEEEDD